MASDSTTETDGSKGEIDYSAIELPNEQETPKPEWSTYERRALVLRLLQRAGHPRAINQTALAETFDCHRTTIHNDLDVLAEYVTQTSSARRDLITESVYEKAIRELQSEGKHYQAAKILSMWNDWLMDRGLQEKAAEKRELAIESQETETDAIRVVNVEGEDLADGWTW